MKTRTILVGIDFTKSGDNALNYAAMLAERGKTSIVLFHVYETPMVHTYSGAYFISFNDIQKYNKEKLDRYKEKFNKIHPGIEILTFASYTSFKAGVKALVKQHKIQLVVLGLKSKNKFSRFLYGTTGVDVAGKVDCPVIIVPETYKRHRLEHNVLAVDNQEYLHANILQKLEDFARQFKVKTEHVHVKTEEEMFVFPEKRIRNQNKKLHVELVEAKDFDAGINKFIDKKHADMVTIISRSHSVFYKLFKETHTKLIAFRSKRPVMAIHE